MLSYSSWLTSHQFKTKHYSSDRFKTTAKTTFKPKRLNTLPVYFILRVHLHELFTNLTNLSCRSLHFFPPFHRLLQPLFPHKVFPLFPHFLQCLWTLSRPFSSFFSSPSLWLSSLISLSSSVRQFDPQYKPQMKFLELLRRRNWPLCLPAEEGA